MKIHIATNRPTGEKCKEIALKMGYTLVSKEDCEVFISVLSNEIISEEYIETRPCFNFHPGLLPFYRGVGIQSQVLINNELATGATLHEMSKNIDEGDIIETEHFFIEKDYTAEILHNKVGILIEKMFKKWLSKICSGDYPTRKQAEEGTTYTSGHLEKVKDLTQYIKAFTFEGKEEAYWIDSKGNTHYIGKYV